MPTRSHGRVKLLTPRISNVWLFTDTEGHRFLVATGHRVERTILAQSLTRAGVVRGSLTAELLTHRHSDHAGNAAWLRDEHRAPVLCHAADAKKLTGNERPARLARRGANAFYDALCHVEDAFPARTSVDDVFDEGSWRWGFSVIPAAGHTEGSSMLLHEPTGTLFTGDAILAGAPVQRLACHRAVLAFLAEERPVRTLCAGHGPKVRRDLPRLFHGLLRRERAA